MTVITVAPMVLKDAVLTVATDDYAQHVSSVTFTPAANTVTWQGLSPVASFSDLSSPTWTCTLEYAQDWTTTNSLAQYLLANAGQSKVVVFKPKAGAGAGLPIFTATVIIAAGPIGGKVNEVQTASVTLGVVGVPVKTATV